ncbi:hypothetical protein Tco_0924213 [Tanacetum coccineum]|uniref:Uncharacterized protein n=1 Tax=Tanacetum coccineum TaxID=301880 RepID=A0ABQ5D9K1_9ASTR
MESLKSLKEPNTLSPETCKYTKIASGTWIKPMIKGKEVRERKETHVKSVSEDEHKEGRPSKIIHKETMGQTAGRVVKLDVSMSNLTPGLTSSKTVDDKGDPPVQKDSQLLDHLDLYAPDTMDPFVDSEIQKESTFTINEKLKSARKGTFTVKDKINSPGISVSENI